MGPAAIDSMPFPAEQPVLGNPSAAVGILYGKMRRANWLGNSTTSRSCPLVHFSSCYAAVLDRYIAQQTRATLELS